MNTPHIRLTPSPQTPCIALPLAEGLIIELCPTPMFGIFDVPKTNVVFCFILNGDDRYSVKEIRAMLQELIPILIHPPAFGLDTLRVNTTLMTSDALPEDEDVYMPADDILGYFSVQTTDKIMSELITDYSRMCIQYEIRQPATTDTLQ